MSSGTASMMLPSALCSASAHNSPSRLQPSSLQPSLNTPEEDDETMSNKADREPEPTDQPRPPADQPRPPADQPRTADRLPAVHRPDSPYGGRHGGLHNKHNNTLGGGGGGGYLPYQPPHGLPAGYSQPTPFPSQEGEPYSSSSSWLHPPSLASGWNGASDDGGFPTSLPSYPSHKDPCPCSYSSSGDDSSPPSSSSRRSHSLPGGRYSPAPGSLEQPHSLHSNPPAAASASSAVNMQHRHHHHHTMSPYHCSPQGAPGACCGAPRCPADFFNGGAAAAARPPPDVRPGYHHPTYGHYYADSHRLPGAGYGFSGHYSSSKQNNAAYNSPLSLEQRRVFVTYEADNDRHVNEIINFVALLRHNGFDTHIDMFEQHFRSISKIDFMERYLSEKEYLIIIIISPKYHETVTAPPVSLEGDERTLNTVYIHKQLQNEFIQNGSKNFRFIPILFPGARKCHVPNWLQNTHVYGWPRDRDDILRRLMRVEKYNPPPIGQLPTIIPIPI